MPKRKTKEEFIHNSINIYGDRYDYSLVEYVNNKTKVQIICKEHGVFLQTPNDHIGGHNCTKCSLQSHKNYNLKEAYDDKNKDFPLYLYVVEIVNEEGQFIKVGISKDTVQRFKNIKVKSKGELNVLLVYPCTLQEATLLEDEILHKLRKNYRKEFVRKFSGHTECLNYEAKQKILDVIKEFITNDGRSDLVGKILEYEYSIH